MVGMFPMRNSTDIDTFMVGRLLYSIAMYEIVHDGGVEQLSHPSGSFKAEIGATRSFGRDALREIVRELDLQVGETVIDGKRHKVFHNDDVAFVMTKDPFIDYESKEAKENQKAVYLEEWGGKSNPLRPARTGEIRFIGDKSAVVTAYNHVRWNTLKSPSPLNKWSGL